MQLVESCVVDAGANVRRTKEGYLTCMPRVARSGVQKYSPQEMNRPDIKRMISVFRPTDRSDLTPSRCSTSHNDSSDLRWR